MDQGIIIRNQGLRNEVRDGGSKRPLTRAAGFSMHAARKVSASSLDLLIVGILHPLQKARHLMASRLGLSHLEYALLCVPSEMVFGIVLSGS